MAELRDLTLLSPGSRIVALYPGGPGRNVAVLRDVTEQSDYPRNVVNLEQIMDAPSGEDVR